MWVEKNFFLVKISFHLHQNLALYIQVITSIKDRTITYFPISFLIYSLKEDYPKAKVVGHRDLPGVKKDCPCLKCNWNRRVCQNKNSTFFSSRAYRRMTDDVNKKIFIYLCRKPKINLYEKNISTSNHGMYGPFSTCYGLYPWSIHLVRQAYYTGEQSHLVG